MKGVPRNYDYDMAARGKARRTQLGLSAKELSVRMRCHCHWVYSLETDGAGTVVSVRRWATALEMDPGELAFGAKTAGG